VYRHLNDPEKHTSHLWLLYQTAPFFLFFVLMNVFTYDIFVSTFCEQVAGMLYLKVYLISYITLYHIIVFDIISSLDYLDYEFYWYV